MILLQIIAQTIALNASRAKSNKKKKLLTILLRYQLKRQGLGDAHIGKLADS